jgi:uncharacterized membrane protein
LLVALTLALAILQLYYAAVSVARQAWPFAVIYTLCGVGGLALSTALWRARRAQRPPA